MQYALVNSNITSEKPVFEHHAKLQVKSYFFFPLLVTNSTVPTRNIRYFPLYLQAKKKVGIKDSEVKILSEINFEPERQTGGQGAKRLFLVIFATEKRPNYCIVVDVLLLFLFLSIGLGGNSTSTNKQDEQKRCGLQSPVWTHPEKKHGTNNRFCSMIIFNFPYFFHQSNDQILWETDSTHLSNVIWDARRNYS